MKLDFVGRRLAALGAVHDVATTLTVQPRGEQWFQVVLSLRASARPYLRPADLDRWCREFLRPFAEFLQRNRTCWEWQPREAERWRLEALQERMEQAGLEIQSGLSVPRWNGPPVAPVRLRLPRPARRR